MNLRWRTASIALLLIATAWLAGANFFSKEARLESPLLPDDGLRWGLDLQGGIHWVVGIDMDEAIGREVGVIRGSLERALTEAGLPAGSVRSEGESLIVQGSADNLEKAAALIGQDFTVLESAGTSETSRSYELIPERKADVRELTMRQVIEVMRRRIDDPVTGIPESVVTRQGEDRVLVQIPGGQIDRDRAYDLLNSTGFLEFKIVKDSAETTEQLEARYPGGLPEGTQIALEKDSATDQVVRAYLVPEEPNLTGDYLQDARVGFDPRQRAEVEFTMSDEGGELFGELSSTHLKEQLAIILDGRAYSAPVLQSRITTRGVITGRFTSEEAADLAVVLRAGALSVPTEILEERTVGPALGQDSIERGTLAAIVGLIGVIAFAIGYYRLSGGYAAFALVANLVMLIGLMSLGEATLTLPGIAGLVLTVGMAVDANVIIFERIREELRVGKTTRAAISTGFNKALWTVLDANITTLFTAIILFQYGTGPIKGFALTLMIGIVTSVFSALVITRLLMQLYPGDRPVELSI